MKHGQATLAATPNGATVLVLAGSRPEPIDEARAGPAIEPYLPNEAKHKAVEADLKVIRAAAKIEYVGKFAQDAPAVAPVPAAPPSASSAGGPGASPASKGMQLK